MLCSLYRVTRHYGGPEEGGWYYSRRHFVGVVFRGSPKQFKVPRGQHVVQLGWSWRGRKFPTQVVRETQAHRIGWEGHDGDAQFMWERRAGQWDTSDRPEPRYE